MLHIEMYKNINNTDLQLFVTQLELKSQSGFHSELPFRWKSSKSEV